MLDRPDTETLIDALLELVDQGLPETRRPGAKRFIRRYYRDAAYEEVAGQEPLSLYGAALAHLNFARSGATPLVRVYNPRFDLDGWQSTHTVAQVVVSDMPFLVDSLQLVFKRAGLTTHLLIHPIVYFRCDGGGRILDVADPGDEDARPFAVMHFELDRVDDDRVLDELARGLESAVSDVTAAVEDWPHMQRVAREAIEEMAARPPAHVSADDLEEAQAFLGWLLDNNYTFLGYRDYRYEERDGEAELRVGASSGYGLLRGARVGKVSQSFQALTPEQRRNATAPGILVITKANTRSTVHRGVYMDLVSVKRWDHDGTRLVGEHRFVGLYAAQAYNRSPRFVPFLRGKVTAVLESADYPEESHSGRALLNILETFPRDILFQVGADDLARVSLAILRLQERQRVRLFIHPDPYGRFFSCLVYVPRERFNTATRRRIQHVLECALGGEAAEFTVHLSESVLARLYFVVRADARAAGAAPVSEIEAKLVEVTRTWKDQFEAATVEHFGEARATRLLRCYHDAFRADYRETYPARLAVYDVQKMESLASDDDIAMSLYRPLEAEPGTLRFKLFRPGRPILLSDVLPMLENMGLQVEDEHPSKVKRHDRSRVWIHDFGLRHSEKMRLDLDTMRPLFQDCFAKISSGEVENDGFNRLVLGAELGWREIVVLRAYAKYLKQIRVAFSQAYIEHALGESPGIARDLVRLFVVRLDPGPGSDGATEDVSDALIARIEAQLDEVQNLDQDRILRAYLALVLATLRTNYFQLDTKGDPKSYLTFKLDPARIPDLPAPRPMYEIFVYSPRVEGVHLRGGRVARGGLRWSDRPEDFRTEVLGLLKAQTVKNAVIVPVGSKGGFVPKRLPAGGTRDDVAAEAAASYQTFVRGLLELTDNLDGDAVIPPPGVVRLDGDDPYLVVAADKGTAAFSDLANAVAVELGFWLDDAFASGGSAGYDHKAMGITARGAWESVKRHFRAVRVDVEREDFTVVGIGDMSGDVFGNGMLLSEHIRLVAAFNHQHIFLDPAPDPARSVRERRRLFELPRSRWDDYDAAAISAGGGVYARSAKSISLSPEARAVLDTDATRLTPNELISVILKAPVDLLWNGGIGTYVKARSESHADVGDRANDAVRVDAAELRCRVVGEGGNLGFTQLARVEFAGAGGRINTDAIDNSGGVDCSDHEVNIKILLNAAVAAGDMTRKQRDRLLAEMTEEVAQLVLAHNYLQTEALEVALHQAPQMLEVHGRLIEHLERNAGLDRALEHLPDREQLLERATAERGLCGPELAVLLAYQKIRLYQELLDSPLPDDAELAPTLESYFPAPLRTRFPDRVPGHRLRREIISTMVANELVNRAGITFVFRLGGEVGASADELARGYLAARDIFGAPALWRAIESLDNRVPSRTQTVMLLEVRKLVERATRWLLRSRPLPLVVSESIAALAPGVEHVAERMSSLLPEESASEGRARAQALCAEGVPNDLAERVGWCEELYSALDIVDVANALRVPVTDVARIYFELGRWLDLAWLRARIGDLPRQNRWQTLARAALRDDLYAEHRELTRAVLCHVGGPRFEPVGAVEEWAARHDAALGRFRRVVGDLMAAPGLDFSMLSVAMREIRTLGRQAPGAGVRMLQAAD